MCLRFMFLLIMRTASWLRLSRREEAWQTAEILLLRHQLAVLHPYTPMYLACTSDGPPVYLKGDPDVSLLRVGDSDPAGWVRIPHPGLDRAARQPLPRRRYSRLNQGSASATTGRHRPSRPRGVRALWLVACQNSCTVPDLGIYSRHSCSFALSICSWSGCSAG
jgi:hypothetical protein